MPQFPNKPWQSRQEMLTDIALKSAISTPEEIRALRPVVPQVLFPETRGFSKEALGIMDVFYLDRAQPSYRSWISGAPVMFRNGFVDGNTESSSRYSMQSLGM